MQDVHVGALDLNLLVALDALLAERHVTRAADRIGLSQPAMSHALSRLRAAFGDPLLVRTPRGMQPTPRAEAMAEPLARALEELGRIVRSPSAFDPSQSKRRFRIATDDYVELVLLPKLLRRLWREAPHVDVSVVNMTGGARADLAQGKIDAVISVVEAIKAAPDVYTQKLFRERFVCLIRHGHPSVGKRLTLDTFVELPHALVAPSGKSGGVVDTALAKVGRRRRVAIEVPHFLAAPHVVRRTDVILTLGERLAHAVAEGLRILPLPLEVPEFTVSLFWHQRHHADPAEVWFRSVITEIAKGL